MFSKLKMHRQQEKLPSFFKIYVPEFSSKGMKFPMAFTLRAQDALPDKVFLRDCYGTLWPVELAKMGNDLFFLNGWVKFVEDNALEVGDFLVFQFNGNNIFDVKLLGRSACEKRGVKALISTVKEEKEKDEEQEVKKDVGVDEILRIEYNHNDDHDDDADEEEKEEEEEEQEVIEISDNEVSKAKSKDCGNAISKRAGEDIRKLSKGGKIARKGTASGRAKPGHEVRDIPETYGADIFKSGLHRQPKNPYFVTKIRPKRRDELYIPGDVVKDYNLDLPPIMTLYDPKGRTYSTKLSTWKDGRIWYTGGWRSLCRWNLVEAEDRCICEFVKENGENNLFLQIHIVRAGGTGASSS